jgi:hypothetical protein
MLLIMVNMHIIFKDSVVLNSAIMLLIMWLLCTSYMCVILVIYAHSFHMLLLNYNPDNFNQLRIFFSVIVTF